MATTTVTPNGTSTRTTPYDRILQLETEIDTVENAAEVLRLLFEKVDDHREQLLALVPVNARAAQQQRLDADWTITHALREHVLGTLTGAVDGLARVDRELWDSRGADRVSTTRRHAAA